MELENGNHHHCRGKTSSITVYIFAEIIPTGQEIQQFEIGRKCKGSKLYHLISPPQVQLER